MRERLTGGGPAFWRCLEELAGTEAFQDMLRREFPDQASEWTNPVTRRRFLMLMGASFALAGLAGCGTQPPVGSIRPYVRQPENLVPGKALYYATAMTIGGLATGLLVESHEGRPTKVEGNPSHPASLGATDAFAQASILTLYDPDRSQTVTYLGQPRGWNEFLGSSRVQEALATQRRRGGEGLRVLTDTVSSPTLALQLTGSQDGGLRRDFPRATWCQYDPARSDHPVEGSRQAFGSPLNTIYRLDRAEVVLSLDADFLSCGPGHLRYVHDFMSRRRVSAQEAAATMNRLYVVECMPSSTGAVADHRLALPTGQVEAFARALAAEMQVAGLEGGGEVAERARRWLRPLAVDLQQHPGSCAVIVGDAQPPFVHALAHAINQKLGNIGQTVLLTDPVEARPENQTGKLRELVADMAAGRVELLLLLGSNPVYDAPADLDFERHMQNVPLRIHLGLYQDETAAQCHWHIPAAHYLESWSDARAFDGTVSVVQPLIAPLYAGRSSHELLAALLQGPETQGHEIVRSYWRQHWPRGNFERGWEQALHEGVVAGTALQPKGKLSLQSGWARGAMARADRVGSLEINFRPDPTIYDGRFANNGWLQELPKPITKLTWDNAVFVSPTTATKFGLTQTTGSQGGQHGQALVDLVEVQYQGRTVQAPVWILPGHADDAVTVHLGYGRTRAGTVGGSADNPVGFSAYRLRPAAAPWFGQGLTIARLDQRFTLACTQMHHSMEGRAPVRAGTLQQYQHDSHSVVATPHENGESGRRVPLSLYPEHDYSPPKAKWGMVIDLTACTGCSACVVACQAENNIPVVGKTEVTRGREMHWLRIDRYYRGELENPETFFQPVPCMHCENAPCELVCPVEATVHSHDGLNDMVYNRCVGTRYCSNNCPYKVRRFNFLQYADYATPSLRLMRNPGVTVRSRGVMEKCTYCVQRIRTAQIEAEVAGRPLRDGDVVTACQAACPAGAIVFGDLNDASSQVAQRRAAPLDYGLLAELNTRPRTTYLAALRNPNPELK